MRLGYDQILKNLQLLRRVFMSDSSPVVILFTQVRSTYVAPQLEPVLQWSTITAAGISLPIGTSLFDAEEEQE
jgi:hypothetical protein